MFLFNFKFSTVPWLQTCVVEGTVKKDTFDHLEAKKKEKAELVYQNLECSETSSFIFFLFFLTFLI